MKKSKISLLAVLMLVVITVSNTVFAVTGSIIDTTKTGSIKITTLEQNNGSATNTPIKDVTYALYKVDVTDGTTVTTVAQAEEAIKTLTPVATKTTGADGVANFTGLVLGRYYAKVTAYPTGSSQIPESFLVDVPMTNEDGNGWIYDIDVQPKVKTASGDVVVTKKDGKGTPMQGVVFAVEVSTEAGVWAPYVPYGDTVALTLTTDAAGQIKLDNLPITYNEKAATYRVVETTVGDKYIMDNKYPAEITITADGKVVIKDTRTNTTAAPVDEGAIEVVNEAPTVVKDVKNDDGTFDDAASASLTDTVSFRITTEVPEYVEDLTTFTLTDTLPAGLANRTNLVVTGIYGEGTNESEVVPTTAYTKDDTNGVLTLTFTPADITKYNTIVVTYDNTIDMTDAVIGSAGNINTAELEYTNKVDVDGTEDGTTTTDDTAKVVTGGVKIHKVDAGDLNLQGAKFKIATTQANAEAGVFVKDETGADIEVTSAADGSAVINGLAYNDDETARDYWLVETQAPTYTETNTDGIEETKSYSLLSAPVKVAVSGTSHTVDVKVVNKKPISLPLTGGIGTVLFALAGVTFLVIAKSIKKEEVQQ